MTIAAEKPKLDREAYRRLPEGPPYYELINGELIEMTRPSRDHYRVAALIQEALGPHVRRTLKGDLAPEPNLFLPDSESVYHPDFVYLTREHRKWSRPDGIYGAPDLICEILSPTTRRIDRYVKLEHFRRAGVPHVWLIEPESPVTVEEYVLAEDGAYRLRAILTAPTEWEPAAFPGWHLPLTELEAAVAPDDEEAAADSSSSA